MDLAAALILIWLLLPISFFALWIRSRVRLKRVLVESEKARSELISELEKANSEIGAMKDEFSPVISIQDRVSEATKILDQVEKNISEKKDEYAEKRTLLNELRQQVAIFNEQISFAELGVYEPHFDFDDSDLFKKKITEVRQRQKDMVSARRATVCPTDWTVEGSRAKGQTMINRQSRLTMRAFNNECEAAIANTRWNNVVAMEKRILNAAKQINAANNSMNLEISDEYVALKIDELHLTYEYREQQKYEKEERAEIARAQREEKKLQAEALAAEKKEKEYEALLDKARSEIGVDQARIAELEAQLSEAHAVTERAKAMAELTKSGYVYVISNIGSFGEDIVKIGLTRRLNPDDRVRELGDASVPFGFDTHAIIYSDDAPALEGALHREFASRRVNMSNKRKEFFRVTLDEVEGVISRLSPESSFFKDREAQEWHETLARREYVLSLREKQLMEDFPLEI